MASVHQTEDLLFSILLQLIIMISAARLLNTFFRKLGQPGVIGEIVAGLLLGPSLLGHFFPEFSEHIFGASPAQAITVISQIGLIFLMFQIGNEFKFDHLKAARNRNGVFLISIVSVGVPFALGYLVGQGSASFMASDIDPVVYSLFIGTALAITAVPILGRILKEFGLTRAELGVVAISSAAINDVVGWLILAGISTYATAQFSTGHLVLQASGVLMLAVGACTFLGKASDWLIAKIPLSDGDLQPNLMAVIICTIFVLGICTHKLGIFTIFGGFVGGLVFHKYGPFVAAWRRQVGNFVLVFFLPVFFTFTGLRTNILGLSSAADLQWLSIVLFAAIFGKIVPVYFAGRLSGFNHHEASTLGALMNTRALMELIVINIGFDLGFVPQKMFTMLVIMAVVTTLMTGPLLRLLLARIGHPIPQGIEA